MANKNVQCCVKNKTGPTEGRHCDRKTNVENAGFFNGRYYCGVHKRQMAKDMQAYREKEVEDLKDQFHVEKEALKCHNQFVEAESEKLDPQVMRKNQLSELRKLKELHSEGKFVSVTFIQIDHIDNAHYHPN